MMIAHTSRVAWEQPHAADRRFASALSFRVLSTAGDARRNGELPRFFTSYRPLCSRLPPRRYTPTASSTDRIRDAQERLHQLALTCAAGVGRRRGAAHAPPRAARELAHRDRRAPDDRPDLVERHAEQVVQDEREPERCLQ